jgi:hypothetical protein
VEQDIPELWQRSVGAKLDGTACCGKESRRWPR